MEKKLYEAMFLVDAKTGDEGLPGMIRHIVELIGRFGGEPERIEKWCEQELAYPIGRTKTGIYLLFYFHAPAENVSDIRRVLNISEQLVRFIILTADSIPHVAGTVFDAEGQVIEVPDVAKAGSESAGSAEEYLEDDEDDGDEDDDEEEAYVASEDAG